MEREEVRALLPLDVDHLDELAGAHLVREGGRRVDTHVESRLGERRRQLLLLVACGASRAAPRRGARTAVARRRRCARPELRRRPSPRARRGTSAPIPPVTTRRRAGSRARRPDRARASRARARAGSRCDPPSPSRITVAGASAFASSAVASSRPSAPSTETSADLAPARVDDRHPLVRPESEHGRASRPDDVRLDERVLREEARGRGPVSRRCSRHALAGAFASISAASAMSFSASSRLPSASSFFTSFSTARRLYDWFQ